MIHQFWVFFEPELIFEVFWAVEGVRSDLHSLRVDFEKLGQIEQGWEEYQEQFVETNIVLS